MARNYYPLTVPADWESEKAIGIDLDVVYADDGTAIKSERMFVPKSQTFVSNGRTYVSQWILERKREDLVAKGFNHDAVNEGLSAVFRWRDRLTQDEPVAEAKYGAIIAAFRLAAEKLKKPRVKIETDHGMVRLRFAKGIVYVDDGVYGGVYYGKIDALGAFYCRRNTPAFVTDTLDAFAADPKGFAASYGKRIGACCFCASELTDDRSIKVGYGPICAGHYGLPWGEEE